MSLSEKLKYSIVIMPDKNGIEYVDKLKDDLNARIGWYNSRSSKAHITIIEFTSDKDELDEIITLLKEVASYENPFRLSFDGVSNYSNGAVFLKPDQATRVPLTELMIRIQKNTNIKNSYKSKDPHISIGRKLSAENVQIALKMFTEVKLDFKCGNLVLRKFDPVRKQYGIYSEDFKFFGELPKPDAQQSLF